MSVLQVDGKYKVPENAREVLELELENEQVRLKNLEAQLESYWTRREELEGKVKQVKKKIVSLEQAISVLGGVNHE